MWAKYEFCWSVTVTNPQKKDCRLCDLRFYNIVILFFFFKKHNFVLPLMTVKDTHYRPAPYPKAVSIPHVGNKSDKVTRTTWLWTRAYLTKLLCLALFGCFICISFPRLHGDPTGLINGNFSDQTNTFVCQGRFWPWLSQTKIYFFLRVLTVLALWMTERDKTPQARGK